MKRWSHLAVVLAVSCGLAQSARATLVAYYPFNGSGLEATGNNINLNLVGNAGFAPSVSPGLGSALSLDGNGDGAIGQNFVKITTNNLTGVAWVRAASLAGDWNSIVKNWGTTLPGQFHFGLGNGAANTLQSIVAGASDVFSPGDLPSNQWVHVAFVADSTALQHRLYLNGQVIGTSAYTGLLGQGSATGLGVGHKPNNNGSGLDTGGGPGPWNGLIDEVGLYNEALSTSQIQQIYQNGLAGIELNAPPTKKRVVLNGLGESSVNVDVTENTVNPTAVVTLGFDLMGNPVTAQPGTPGEVVANLVDDFVAYDGPEPNLAKWNDVQGDTIMLPVHMQLDQPRAVRYYTLTSANDAPPRDPWQWRLLGTNVANPASMADFTLLDERTGVEFSERHQTQVFPIANNVAYTTYRFEFKTELVAGGPTPGTPNSIQLAEVELFQNMTFTGANLTVDRNNGSLTLTNGGNTTLALVGYSITSAQGLLNSNTWLSIADNYDGDNGAEIDIDTWLRMTASNDNHDLSEVENPNGSGGAPLAPGQSINLGNAWIRSAVEDLFGTIVLADGTRRGIAIDYVGNTLFLAGDYNEDGIVNAADYVVWRKYNNTATTLPNDSTPGLVNGADYIAWRSHFGQTAGSGAIAGGSSAVPEPESWILVSVLAGLVWRPRRRPPPVYIGRYLDQWPPLLLHGSAVARNFSIRRFNAVTVLTASFLLLDSAAFGTTTIDRNYQFGDDSQENAVVGQTVGQSSVVANHTLDSASQGSFFDMPQTGGPTYANVGPTGSARPGAVAGQKGIQFTGSSSQFLGGTLGFGAPREGGALANPPITTYADTRIMQVWARPTLDTGARQDIVNDTFQFGIHITANDTWGYTYGGSGGVGFVFDTGAAVNYNQWTHVMQRTFGRSGVAVYINGVAVSRFGFAYLETTPPGTNRNIYVGTNLGATGNFFTGQLDNLKIAVADIFFLRPPSEPIPVDWGAFNLATDNEYIVSRNLVVGDVNGDGVVNGTGAGPAIADDVRFFIDHWLDERLVNGILTGDLLSRTTMGDLNFDGRTNLADWPILQNAHVGGAGLDLAALLGGVPEPSTAALSIFAMLSISGCARRLSRFRRASLQSQQPAVGTRCKFARS
jgi:hypothetical protein